MDFKKLPKVELHLHIDCSLSYEVVKKIDPSITQQQYMQEFVPAGKCTNLDDFLNRSVKVTLCGSEDWLYREITCYRPTKT
jgi:adenosine deaminase